MAKLNFSRMNVENKARLSNFIAPSWDNCRTIGIDHSYYSELHEHSKELRHEEELEFYLRESKPNQKPNQ